MNPTENIPWLAITKPATKKIIYDLTNKNITNSDIAVLMFIVQKMNLTNEYKSPTQEELIKKLQLSKHRLSVAYTNLKSNGYFLKINKSKTYIVNPYLFYIGSTKFLSAKRNKWDKLWNKYTQEMTDKNKKINIELEKFFKNQNSIFEDTI
ncbi:MAG: hypothetical protein K2O64_01045 [Lactobacillus sp.]|nr:hypothetical protein [Lactobacillus sp.]